ncbi:AMP-binding protein [Flavobacterium sp. DG1-102-2]|uniref:AMP-binding protein n=1 Tax=Flavobacterium sp. DG1-102-2 TaxID=3081663 RepID=UPI00294A1E5E|nr:AMP-binding protein [Flavobacterium sp. DG1-102-2]MDV6168543.1 AMP-binding protein [Flavobacterium sp. DG1-102-2]
MTNPDYHFVHPHFKLNGFHLTEDDLCRIAYSFIKEGEAYERAVGNFLLDWFDQRTFIEMQTSGTTGSPKLITVDKQAMVHSALATAEFFDLSSDIKVLHCLPTQFVAGKMMLVRAFILGWDMDLVAPVSTPLQNNDTQYHFAAMVPFQAQHSLEKLQQIKKLILGGAKVSQSLSKQLEVLPTEVFETYGMTETITHIAAKKVGEEAFTVLPNVRVSEDERHCLIIDPYVICDEPIVTNDVVKVLDDTHFIWLGRYDNVINSGGVKLFPEQIEEKLSSKIQRRFFVKGIPDEELGEKLVLVIEGDRYDIDPEIFAKLGKFEKPKEVLFVPEFTETGSGKLQREETLKSLA